MRHLVLTAALLLAAGCGSSAVVDAPAADRPYDGPLDLAPSADNPDVMRRSGSAGLALECDGTPANGGGSDVTVVRDAPDDAVDAWMDDVGRDFGGLPSHDYRLELQDNGRILYSYDAQGETKAAVIVADSIRDGDDTGWGVESWAMCDPAELPDQLTDEMGIEIWEDGSGNRVPTGRISSGPGAEHCDWQDVRFMTLDSDTDRRQFVRDVHGEFGTLTTTYDGSAALPPDATDTDLHRDGLHLWLAADGSAAYLVSESDPGDVERWPNAPEPIYCG